MMLKQVSDIIVREQKIKNICLQSEEHQIKQAKSKKDNS